MLQFSTELSHLATMSLSGRLVVEIFEDQLPTTCRHLMNRCREGMEDTFKNTVIYKIVPDLAAYGGQSRG